MQRKYVRSDTSVAIERNFYGGFKAYLQANYPAGRLSEEEWQLVVEEDKEYFSTPAAEERGNQLLPNHETAADEVEDFGFVYMDVGSATADPSHTHTSN